MKHKTRKLIVSLLILTMLISIFPTAALAADYTEWSSWSTTVPARKDGREIETRDVPVSYTMVSYTCGRSDYYRCYLKYPQSGYTVRMGPSYYTLTPEQFQAAETFAQGAWWPDVDWPGYIVGPGTGYVSPYANGIPCFIDSINYETQYRYRDRVNSVIEYFVRLDYNDGTIIEPGYNGPGIMVTYGYPYGSLPFPSRRGYGFLGWYTEKNGGTRIISDTIVTNQSPHTLYAHWQRDAGGYVSFNANGGTCATSSMLVTYDEPYGTLPVAYRDGYTFDGWFTALSGGSRVTEDTIVPFDTDLTLYAHWTQETSKIYTVTFNPNGGSVSQNSKTVTNGSTYGSLPTPTRNGYTFDGWFTAANGGTIVTASTTVNLSANQTLYAHWTGTYDPYNLGDETYSFKNFSDSYSNGYCFGMSITSAAYHLNLVPISRIGGNANTRLYDLGPTETVLEPIREYQFKQGISIKNATVAGGTFDKSLQKKFDIASDWRQVVNYVSDHRQDDTGQLQIIFWKANNNGKLAGHAVNFLRYEKVNGQDRIYAYDNNFPDQETYFYQDSSGKVLQAPRQTLSGEIDSIGLADVRKYFKSVENFDVTHVLYMYKDAATVQGYNYFIMVGDFTDEEYVMYEIPSDEQQVIIVPNRDNASFIYMDKEYSFGSITDNTIGELNFPTLFPEEAVPNEVFRIYEAAPAPANPFTDVAKGAYYYDAVLWAVGHDPQITNGTSANTFSPDATCTRGQVVTFLWRAAGCPEPTGKSNPFNDVTADAYYYKAVLWAVEKGITKGASATNFSPDDGCTRGQVVTFLHRYENTPATDNTANPFTDVASSAYYYDAVLWAVNHDPQITNGTSAATFSPDATCTRGQIVTFLYRDMNG